ncbi:MAG: DUF3179 domain-containing protein [Thermodesulfovibrionia bacterium]|nr:DUF3179 domain-containing protein [Thermodesulfovibrionia bacterium]
MYSRTIDNQVLTLIPSGWTYKNTFVLYDRESGTLWYPYRKGLKGIQGTYFNRWLPKVHSEDTSWGRWKIKHPKSKILK